MGEAGIPATRAARSAAHLGLSWVPCARHAPATSALVLPRLDAGTVSLHLADIGREAAPGAHAVLVRDGAGFHIAASLQIPDNITLLKLPPYSPELNPVENIWEYLRGNILSNTVFDNYDHIVTTCCQAWNFFTDDPKRVASITTRPWAQVNL